MTFKRKAFVHYTIKLVANERIAMERERARTTSVPPNVSDMDIAAAKNGVIAGEWVESVFSVRTVGKASFIMLPCGKFTAQKRRFPVESLSLRICRDCDQ
jgi:hypothetical protein